jgi:hypothetical protein
MLGAALLIPLLIGAAAIFVAEPERRPHGLGLLAGIVRGFPFTLVLAVTIVILALASLVRKIRSLAKRWEDAHVPVIVKPGGYDRVLGDLQGVLHDAGLDVQPRPAPTILSIPPRLLDAVAGKALGGLVPDRLMLLTSKSLDVLVYPSDVALSGTRESVARARAAIAAQLTDSPAYLTTSAESERIEDEIRDVAAATDRVGSAGIGALTTRIQALDRQIARLMVPFDEWETVYRERLQIERDLLAKRLDVEQVAVADQPLAGPGPPRRQLSPADWVLAGASIGLLALDVALLIEGRFGRARRHA